MSEQKTWRDRVQVHPAADLFPMLSPAKLKELADDIAKHGLRNGIVFWTPTIADARSRKLPDEVFLLDGRNRLAALDMVYEDEEERQEAFQNAIYIDSAQEGCASLLDNETDPYAY